MEVEVLGSTLYGVTIARPAARGTSHTLKTTRHEPRPQSLAPAESDDALLASFRAGHAEAFTLLFERHNRPLFYYALKLVGDAGAAEDLTQELWEKVIDLRSDWTQVRNAGGFFVRVLRNLALDYLKHHRFQSRLDDTPELRAPSESGLTDREEVVLQSLDALRLESKEILVLHYYSGYSFEEIALLLDKKPNAIWTRASRARAELRREIEKRFRRMERTGTR